MTESNQFQPISRPLEGKFQPFKGIPAWRLWLPLAFQAAIILAAPIQPVYTLITGKTVILETVPVDPYDFLRGYSQSLKYDISSQDNLRRLPGWQKLANPQLNQKSNSLLPAAATVKYLPIGTSFYVILAAPLSGKSNPPQPWQPVRVSRDRPSSLPKNQIALKGKSIGYSVEYGLETYYMPENRRNEINQDINQAQLDKKRRHSIVAEVKVDAQGRAVPVSFWVSDRHYRF